MVADYFGLMDQVTAGVNWKFADDIRIQAEHHKVKGIDRLALIFTSDIVLNNTKYWDI